MKVWVLLQWNSAGYRYEVWGIYSTHAAALRDKGIPNEGEIEEWEVWS